MSIDTILSEAWDMLTGRSSGPMHLRVFLQPTIAAAMALHAGWIDARDNRPPYFAWTLFTDAQRRPALMRQMWGDVGKVFIVALVLDVVYQVIVFQRVYPVQTLIVAFTLAIVPYLVLRGPVAHLVRRLRRT